LWHGDWAKGYAGGYGTKDTDWRGQYDVWELKQGIIAESTKWTSDFTKKTGTIVYSIRQGVHFGLDTANPVSKQINGREVTADDVIAFLKQATTNPNAYLYKTNLVLRSANITKTGPWEVSVTLPLDGLITGIFRFSDCSYIQPAELWTANWQKRETVVGTGPYVFTEYVPASSMVLMKNTNYWQKNPIGPGKGDPLPYVDRVVNLIIPDTSTRQAALRTGRVDTATGYSWEDANMMRKQVPTMKESLGEVIIPTGSVESLDFPCDTPPFNDIRVRRAMFMGTDLKSINDGVYHSQAQILTWPFPKTPGYEDLYLGLDDPEMPASVKDLYTYNPEKAKALLKEAGFPNGFKTKALVNPTQVDFYSIIKDQWSKIGIQVDLDVREIVAKQNLLNTGKWDCMADGGMASNSAFHSCPTLTGTPSANANTSRIFDPKIDQGLADIRNTIVKEGMKAGMKQTKELMKYVLDQAYAIPVPYTSPVIFWWPWVKNYSGEQTIGYYDGTNWVPYIWIDQNLKKTMGH